MTSFIEEIFSNIFGENVILATILIAMVPIIELKGAIPFSMAVDIWGANALSFLPAFLCGLLGSSLIVPILALIYLPIINWLKKTRPFRRLAIKIDNRLNKKKDDINKKIEEKENYIQDINSENNALSEAEILKRKNKKAFWVKFTSVFIFVAIPLPLTGVWTGTCLAVILGLNFWQTCLCLIPANLLAGLIITFISTLFGDSTWVLVLILIGIILLIALLYLIKKIIFKIKAKKDKK